MPRRALFSLAAALAVGAARLDAQVAALNSDLWRVAAGTRAAPAPFADGATALLWNPVVLLPAAADVRLGVTSIHAPEDVGVTGGAVAFSGRVGASVISAVWGSLGIGGIARTETSPEAVDGDVPVDAQLLALGLARPLAPWLQAGAALRISSARLDVLTRTAAGLDLGAVAALSSRVRVGAVIRAFDPMGTAAASYDAAVEARSATFDGIGTPAFVRLRYGVTVQSGEDPAHLFTLGLCLGDGLQFDAGAAREAAADQVVWRSRVGVSAGSARYRVEFGRDGGVNGFGATYAFGVLAQLK